MGYMKLWDKKTGENRGYIAADAVQNVMVVPDKSLPNDNLCPVSWYQDSDGQLWLDSKNAAFQRRQLGLGSANVADWGIPSPGGWRNPLIYHADKTIELKDHPNRFLSLPNGIGGSVYWSGDANDPTILCGQIED